MGFPILYVSTGAHEGDFHGIVINYMHTEYCRLQKIVGPAFDTFSNTLYVLLIYLTTNC